METQYYKSYSPALGRDMEMKRYGHAGRPVLFVPCQNGRFFDFENFHMTDTFAPWIEDGKCIVFAIDTIDAETWSDKNGDPYHRIRHHEQWINYITREVVPFIRDYVNEKNGWEGYPGIMTFGCSMGATHALNLYLRFPDLFDLGAGFPGNGRSTSRDSFEQCYLPENTSRAEFRQLFFRCGT